MSSASSERSRTASTRGRLRRSFFEVPDTGRVLRETAFWDIYYEHCSYFTPGSMARAFRAAGFAPTRLELGFDDQYIQLDAKRGSDETTLPLEDSAEEVAEEAAAFVARLEDTRALWLRRLGGADDRGEVVAMWGAGSKGVGFLAALGEVAGIACVVDVNPAKHGMFMPGTGHEIVAAGRTRRSRPEPRGRDEPGLRGRDSRHAGRSRGSRHRYVALTSLNPGRR